MPDASAPDDNTGHCVFLSFVYLLFLHCLSIFARSFLVPDVICRTGKVWQVFHQMLKGNRYSYQ